MASPGDQLGVYTNDINGAHAIYCGYMCRVIYDVRVREIFVHLQLFYLLIFIKNY